MAEQTFRSPNFYEREIDLSAPRPVGPVGTPAGVIGTANKGPAFVPVTVGNFDEFVSYFGNVDPKRFGPYAVNEFLKHRTALTYMRVLGAGANTTSAHLATTAATGRVQNAGFYLDGNTTADTFARHNGVVQFLTARHTLQANEAYGMPLFTDNDSFNGSTVHLVRGVIMTPSSSRVMVLAGNATGVSAFGGSTADSGAVVSGEFKIVISSSQGNSFWNSDNNPGVKIMTASFDPTSPNYFAKILNTDPDKFVEEQHYLYADFSVDDELATATFAGILSGSTATSTNSGDTSLVMRKAFGAFNDRFRAPRTTSFISQPFGATEYDLFSFEALDDGEYANKLYKISIANLKASLDDSNPYGTFSVYVRDWNDTDSNPLILESFPNCSLNPYADNYVGKVIGDRKVTFNFDADVDTERRLVATGKYVNNSKYVRVQVSDAVDRALVPQRSLPFGFRGASLLKTNDSLTDTAGTNPRIAGVLGNSVGSALSGSIVPPVPFRFKVTKGETLNTATWSGQPGSTELAVPSYYWGVKFERNTLPLNPNITNEKNKLLESYTKFMGIEKLDVLVTGSGADTLNNDKFSLSKVVLGNSALGHLTSSVNDHMREAAYVRNAKLDSTNYTYTDPAIGTRITLATLLASGTAAEFNKFSPYAKFTTFLAGGWDGVNILDKNARRLNDKASSFDVGGSAESSFTAPGMSINPNGTGQTNSTVLSYMKAIDIMTDPYAVNSNVLTIPGIRDSFITDYAMKKVRDYGLAFYVMDIPSYDDSGNRLFDDSTARPSVDQTATALDTRVIDNDYVGTYWSDVYVDDKLNRRKVKVPASVAAMGALAFNDRVSYPWFAPAGFNRAALDFVSNVAVRLNVTDRDRLYDSRINPIATFPRLGFVIYGQKTLKINKSSLDRVNVRRLIIEVKRIITDIARNLTFEQNTPDVRNRFVSDSILQLGLIKAQSGVESFQVVMNETNNTKEDENLNRLNGRVTVIPTRTVEFIQIDFVITQSGITFV